MMLTRHDSVVLTDEQKDAIDAILTSNSRIQTLGGYAGTGKTTVIKELVNRLPGYRVCAYTGKAADVLRRKGIPATTIHSLIYHPVKDDDGEVVFELVPKEIFAPTGLIVDEASMVGASIYADLKTFNIPIIFVGDHGQLEPVNGGGLNLMESPDVVLETVHRNAGPIARFAEHLRRGGSASEWEDVELGDSNEDGNVTITTLDKIGDLDFDRDCQMICAYNRTRHMLNKLMREHIGMPEGVPEVGDRVMCLQNNKTHCLFNGMQGIIKAIDRGRKTLVFDDGRGSREPVRVNYLPSAFGSDIKVNWSDSVVPFDWSYCVTCHKAQGDEFDEVCVIEQKCGAWEHRRWAYTAASRAKKNLIWVKA